MSYAVCRGLSQDLDVLRGMSGSEPGPGFPTQYVGVLARTWMSYAVCRGLCCVQWFEVGGGCSCLMVLVELLTIIGGIVDHYCLNFPFIIH